MKDPLTLGSGRFWGLVGVIVPLLALLATLATGYLVSSGSGGFPIPWREVLFEASMGGCPVVGLTSCRIIGVIQVSYDWLSFVIDVLFYIGVGYSIVLSYAPTGLVLKKLVGR